jgi:hypothetical protein
MKFKVEKNVKQPITNNKHEFPLSSMSVGDSFYIPKSEYSKETSMRVCVNNRAYHYNIKNGKDIKLSIRKDEGGLRVWRVK